MNINRNNYQMWIIDHYDGSLQGDQEEELFLFLDQNPDIREEFDLYGHPVVFPGVSQRVDKESLKRDVNQLADDQRAYLLIALSEGDLSDENSAELAEYIENNKELADEFNTIKSIRLSPPDISYPYKSRLKRMPFGQKGRKIVLRVLSLSAAAAIIISFWLALPDSGRSEIESPIMAQVTPEISERSFEELTEAPSETEKVPEIISSSGQIREISPDKLTKAPSGVRQSQQEVIEVSSRESISIPRARFADGVALGQSNNAGFLAEMIPVEIIEPARATSPREFIAKSLRELVLKEGGSSTDRLKGYEVADVTLIGVNKVMGWDMKLDRETDSEGNINNLKFTSQLIKFDHKIKNISDGL